MARKYKRSASVQSSVSTPKPENEKNASVFSRRGAAAEFNPDYSYVIKDLKRIGVLAGSFFVVLVVLSFFLNR